MVLGDTRFLPTIDVMTTENGRLFKPVSQLYVATPAVLSYLGVDPTTIRPSVDFIVDRRLATKKLQIPSSDLGRGIPLKNVHKIEVGTRLFGGDSGRNAASFITLNGLRRHGWQQVPGGWLAESSRPLTSKQIADARDAAASARLATEVRRKKNPPSPAVWSVW